MTTHQCFPWCDGHLGHPWENICRHWAAGLVMSMCPERCCPGSGQLVVVRKSMFFPRMLLPPAWEEGSIHSPFVISPMKMHDQMHLWYFSWQLVEVMSSPWIESESVVTPSEWRLTQCRPMTGQPVLRNQRGPVWMLEETRRPFLGGGGRCQRGSLPLRKKVVAMKAGSESFWPLRILTVICEACCDHLTRLAWNGWDWGTRGLRELSHFPPKVNIPLPQ